MSTLRSINDVVEAIQAAGGVKEIDATGGGCRGEMPLPTLAARITRTKSAGRRLIVGMVGAPGAGKSTIAAAVVEQLNSAGENSPSAILLPMDGFHLPQARLVELGRRDRMGAPDTFDVAGLLATLAALRSAHDSGGPDVENSGDRGSGFGASGNRVLAPGFDRTIEEAVPDAIVIGPEFSTVVVEGNYLLLDSNGWGAVAPLLDLSFGVTLERDIRLARLLERHVRFGKSFEEARAWSLGPDEANARLIAATMHRADHTIAL